jgi:hypothetical protein
MAGPLSWQFWGKWLGNQVCDDSWALSYLHDLASGFTILLFGGLSRNADQAKRWKSSWIGQLSQLVIPVTHYTQWTIATTSSFSLSHASYWHPSWWVCCIEKGRRERDERWGTAGVRVRCVLFVEEQENPAPRQDYLKSILPPCKIGWKKNLNQCKKLSCFFMLFGSSYSTSISTQI